MTARTERGLTRIVVVDDHALLRDGLREILEAEDDFVVVGEAGTSEQAAQVAAWTSPDVVVLDIEMPGAGVTNTLIRILEHAPHTRVIILSMYDQPATLQELLAMGIRGYLLKSVTRHELVSAVRSVRDDDERLVLSVSRSSLAQLNGSAPSLSRREHEVIELVAQAMSNAQIAKRLSITENTVKRHLRNVFAKLGAVSRVDAVNKAIAASLIASRSQGRDR